MDKSWINQHRLHPDYINGVKEFVNLACERDRKSNQVTCPCKLCRNVKLVEKGLLGEHLMINGFLPNYTKWIFHGESSSSSMPESDSSENDDMLGMLHDAFGVPPPSLMPSVGEDSSNVNTTEGMDEKTKNFFKLLKEYEKELYPGCEKYSTLSFIVRLLHVKCLFGWSDKSFTVLLELLKDAFPKGETLPKSFYATRALLRGLGLDYYKVHACPKDCSLYWKETAKRTDCIVCHTPRYKEFEGEECDANKKRHKVPQKIVRYFPSIPRLQSLYRTHETASHMKWHADGRTKDSKMRHPADTPVWKTYDNMYPDFGREPRNVRLGLAADGFNPFKSMNVSHSTWPVILIPYNLPPWLCMKQPYMMLSLLIDGPSSPGNNIDVYLSLVVDELKELWEVGVQTYDAASGQMFQMRAALLWTINDFPAFAMLSGWSTKGALACPCCHVYTRSLFLKPFLKSYVRSRSYPEGSIAQGYLVEESMTFCSRYLHDVETKLRRPMRNYDVGDNPEILKGRALGKGKGFVLSSTSRAQAHRYMLFNTASIAPYREEHRKYVKMSNRRLRDYDVDRRHNAEFPIWFKSRVEQLLAAGNVELADEVKTLAVGPREKAIRFSGYIINGCRYHTKSRELRRKTQNSGIMVDAKTCSYASAKDMNPLEGDVTYYGYVTDIIELYYAYDCRYLLFMCNWIDNNKGLKKDDYGFTLVNFKHLLYMKPQESDEPYILASQAQQVFYVQDPVEDDWNVVLKMKPRDLYEVGEQLTGEATSIEGFCTQDLNESDEDVNWVRQDVPGITVDETNLGATDMDED